jgi:hypothetical protein
VAAHPQHVLLLITSPALLKNERGPTGYGCHLPQVVQQVAHGDQHRPTKSAVVVFAPQFAPEASHSLHWAALRPPPRMRTSTWGSSCTWHTHIQHAAGKGRAASYAAAPILDNRRLHLAVRRMVLLSVVRLVMDYAATVWHGTDAELTKIEQVQSVAQAGGDAGEPR